MKKLLIFVVFLMILSVSVQASNTLYDDFSSNVFNNSKWYNNSQGATSVVSMGSNLMNLTGTSAGSPQDAQVRTNLSLSDLGNNFTIYLNNSINGVTGANYILLYNSSNSVNTLLILPNGESGKNFTFTVINTTQIKMYKDNVLNTTFNTTTAFGLAGTLYPGFRSNFGSGSNGRITLGRSYYASNSVTLDKPINVYMNITNQINFSSTAVVLPNVNFTNATLYIWDSNYNLINKTINTVTGSISNFSNWTISNLYGYYFWNTYWCFEGASCTFSTQNYSFINGLKINSIRYNNESYITSSESFVINITTYNITLSSAKFIYASQEYSPTVINNNNNITLSSLIDLSLVSANNTFYWSFNFGDFTYNTSLYNQTVYPISIDDCSVNTKEILNFTLKDEDNLNRIAGNIDIGLNLYNPTRTILASTYNNNFTIGSTGGGTRICISNLTTEFSLDYQAKYYGNSSYVSEYFTDDYLLVNSSTALQNINLYDLLTTRSQEFLVTFKDSNFIPSSGAIVEIQRQYLALGQNLIVESAKTDSDGRTIVHLVPNEEVYTINIYKNGVLISTYPNVRAFCSNIATGDCQINLNQIGGLGGLDGSLVVGGVSISGSYSESSRTYQITFSVQDGTNNLMLLNLTDLATDLQLCSNSITASSGTLSCTIPATYTNGTILIRAYSDGSLIYTDTKDTRGSLSGVLGYSRLIFAVLLMITLPLMAISSGPVMLIFFLIGAMLAGGMFFIDWGGWMGPASSFIWLVIATLILIWVITRRER